MNSRKRLLPSKPFPPYAFLPGRNDHPNLAAGYRVGIADPRAEKIDVLLPENNDELRFALDLFNHEYYWESHIYWEALWNAHERTGPTAEFLKGLIKLAAAGVKFQISETLPAQTHLQNAIVHLKNITWSEGDSYLGFSLHDLIDEIDAILQDETGKRFQEFRICPNWSVL